MSAPLTPGSVAYVRGIIASAEREKDDFYPTPPEATHALLAREAFGPQIWEPACGDGAISKILEASGHKVVSTDLFDRGYGEHRIDFLMEQRLLAPEIVTNPPFKLAEQFVLHALNLGATKVAMLLRLAWLEGIERKALFQSTPLKCVHVASRRLSMARGDQTSLPRGGMIAFAWFIWDRSHSGAPSLQWFDWKEAA